MDPLQQFLHALHFQRRTEITRKNIASGNQFSDLLIGNIPTFQIMLQKLLITHGKVFLKSFKSTLTILGNLSLVILFFQFFLAFLIFQFLPIYKRAEIHAPAIQTFYQIFHQSCPVSSLLVHLIYKYKYRYPVTFQQPPQSLHMALNPVRTTDHQNGIIQYGKRPFHLRRKIHMPWGIHQRHRKITKHQLCLFRKNRDPPCPFQFKIVKKRILMVHSPHLANTSRQI